MQHWEPVGSCEMTAGQSLYIFFILISSHSTVKIAHLRVQQQPGRKISSFYMREPDISRAPQTNLPVSQTAASSHNHTAGSWWILQHPAAYLEVDFTAQYTSLWKAFSEFMNRNFYRDRLIISLTNIFHRYSHFWFFNIGFHRHSVGLQRTPLNNKTKSSTGNSSAHRKPNLLFVCRNYTSFYVTAIHSEVRNEYDFKLNSDIGQIHILGTYYKNIHNALYVFIVVVKWLSYLLMSKNINKTIKNDLIGHIFKISLIFSFC